MKQQARPLLKPEASKTLIPVVKSAKLAWSSLSSVLLGNSPLWASGLQIFQVLLR